MTEAAIESDGTLVTAYDFEFSLNRYKLKPKSNEDIGSFSVGQQANIFIFEEAFDAMAKLYKQAQYTYKADFTSKDMPKALQWTLQTGDFTRIIDQLYDIPNETPMFVSCTGEDTDAKASITNEQLNAFYPMRCTLGMNHPDQGRREIVKIKFEMRLTATPAMVLNEADQKTYLKWTNIQVEITQHKLVPIDTRRIVENDLINRLKEALNAWELPNLDIQDDAFSHLKSPTVKIEGKHLIIGGELQ